MSFVVALLSVMGFWQLDFLITGISANIFLNSCIFFTFFFGVYTAFVRVLGLKNEIFALKSLREDYDDAVNAETQDEEDKLWRFHRCEEKAIVVHPPKILERPFTILSEEIAQTQGLKVTTGVMQNLLDSVDEQLDDGRSLISYITGLLVFLGLIGTFIGLMVTLGSVGDIIGGLDLSAGAGAETIQKLMNDLMIPLQGMATGFSSSLFGLITSLALGLVALFGNQAANSFKAEFATWLAGVAKVRADSLTVGAGVHDADFASPKFEKSMSIMYRVAKFSLISNARVMTTVEALSNSCKTLIDAQMKTQEQTMELTNSVHSLAEGIASKDQIMRDMATAISADRNIQEDIKNLMAASHQSTTRLRSINSILEDFKSGADEFKAVRRNFEDQLSQRDKIETLTKTAQLQVNHELERLSNKVDDLSSTVKWLDDSIDERTEALNTSARELAALAQNLTTEVDWTIAQSREIRDQQEMQNGETPKYTQRVVLRKKSFLDRRWRKK